MDKGDVNVLIVDDVNAIRVQLKEILKSFGFKKMKAVQNAEEAMQILEDEQFQIILCDWHVGPTSGLEFLKYVRQHPDFKNLAFVMVTAENTKEGVLQAIQAGIDDYIVKPITIASMDKVHRALIKRQVL
jgi:two-component system chemotaxis response regulator CheY